jgi:hypothetical protein
MDIGLHATVQVDPDVKSEIVQAYPLRPSVSFGDMLKYKYLVVVDGNTWPSRIQSYLQTNSVILYNGIFIDWYPYPLHSSTNVEVFVAASAVGALHPIRVRFQ